MPDYNLSLVEIQQSFQNIVQYITASNTFYNLIGDEINISQGGSSASNYFNVDGGTAGTLYAPTVFTIDFGASK